MDDLLAVASAVATTAGTRAWLFPWCGRIFRGDITLDVSFSFRHVKEEQQGNTVHAPHYADVYQ